MSKIMDDRLKYWCAGCERWMLGRCEDCEKCKSCCKCAAALRARGADTEKGDV